MSKVMCQVTSYREDDSGKQEGVKCENEAIVSITPLVGQGAGQTFHYCADHARMFLSGIIDTHQHQQMLDANGGEMPVMQMGGGAGIKCPTSEEIAANYPQAGDNGGLPSNAKYDAEGNLRVYCPGATGVPGERIDSDGTEEVVGEVVPTDDAAEITIRVPEVEGKHVQAEG